MKRNLLALSIVTFFALTVVSTLGLSVHSAFAVTGSKNPNDHIDTFRYSTNGVQITEIWYREIPHSCSSKDRLIARITLQSCQFTIYACIGGWCTTYNSDYCADAVERAVEAFLEQYYTYVIATALIVGGYATVTVPYWGPLIALSL